MNPRNHILRILAAIALVVVAVVAVGCGDGDESSTELSGLRLAAGGAATELMPKFEPDTHSYVARCESVRLDVTTRAPDGAGVSVNGRPASGSTASVAVRPGHNFTIAVDGEDGAEYSVRCLPAGFPEWTHQELRDGTEGMFMVTFPVSNWVIVFDQDGVPRWWYRSPTTPLGGQISPDGTVIWSRSFGDGYGLNPRMAHEEHALDGSLIDVIRAHGAVVDAHEHYPLEDGAYVDSYVPRYPVDLSEFGGPSRAGVVDAEIEQIDEQGNLVWSWTSKGRIPLEETDRWWPILVGLAKPGPPGVPADLPVLDPVHINTIEPWGDQVVTSMRHLDAVFGIDRATGDIEWKLGGTPRPESLRVIGDPRPIPFGGQHDARVWGDGLLSVYDNAVRRGHPPRGVLYQLDVEKGTATFVRQFTDPKVPGPSRCCGSMRRFDDGWLVGWGDTPWVTAFDAKGRIRFRMSVPGLSYRAVPVLPEQATLEDLEQGLEDQEAATEAPEPTDGEPTAAEEDRKPVVLLIHGGSWLRGGPPAMDIPGRMAREMGFRAVQVEYPLGDLLAANQTVRRIAANWRERGHQVVTLGESAGGQIAALLAAEGRVDYAVANAPVSNLLTWWEGGDEEAFWEGELDADEALRRRMSPLFQPHRNPVLVLHSRKDPVVKAARSIAYDRKFPQVTLRWVGGCHILDCNLERGYHYHRNNRIGLAWLAQRTGLDAP